MLHEDPTLVIDRVGPVMVSVWRDAPTVIQLQSLTNMSVHARREQGHLALLNIVIGGTPKFSAEVRELAATRMRDGTYDVVAHVILLPGFVGSATRAFISTITLLGRVNGPSKIVADLHTAVDWLVQSLRDRELTAPTPTELLATARRHML